MMRTIPSQDLKNETLELLHAYEQSPSTQLRNRLVQMNIGLARREVYRWLGQCSETYDDLLQVGCLGLIRAIERFDLSKGHAFSSFAVPYIRGEIQHYLRDKSPSVRIPRQWLDLQRQVTRSAQTLHQKLGRKPTESELAVELGISREELGEVKLASRNRAPLSLDAPVSDEEDGSTSLGAMLPDRKYRSFQLAQEDRLRLQQALGCLEEGTRHVLEFVFLQDLTQKETAERMGISAVTVSRRVKRGLKSLHQFLGGNED